MEFKVGDEVIITLIEDECFGVKGKVTKVTKNVYHVLWEDEERVIIYESLSHFCRKLTKLERALK